MLTLFVTVSAPDLKLADGEQSAIGAACRRLQGLRQAQIMIPDRTPVDQPFASDGAGPSLALQLDFDTLDAAQAAVGVKSSLADVPILQRLPASSIHHQLMRRRSFPTASAPPADPCLTFLVTYPGTAPDPLYWLDYYDAHHPPVMVRFPRIREVETFRPVEWSSSLPFVRDHALQRNKVVFDNLADLVAALASPVMLDMRADAKTFPPFQGKATHFPMKTWHFDGKA